MNERRKAKLLAQYLDALLDGESGLRPPSGDSELQALATLGRSLAGIRFSPGPAHPDAVEGLLREHRPALRSADVATPHTILGIPFPWFLALLAVLIALTLGALLSVVSGGAGRPMPALGPTMSTPGPVIEATVPATVTPLLAVTSLSTPALSTPATPTALPPIKTRTAEATREPVETRSTPPGVESRVMIRATRADRSLSPIPSTLSPTLTPKAAPTETPKPARESRPSPTASAAPTSTPAPTDTAEPTATPEPTATAEPTDARTCTTAPTDTPQPAATPTCTPAPTDTAEPTASPADEATQMPTAVDDDDDECDDDDACDDDNERDHDDDDDDDDEDDHDDNDDDEHDDHDDDDDDDDDEYGPDLTLAYLCSLSPFQDPVKTLPSTQAAGSGTCSNCLDGSTILC